MLLLLPHLLCAQSVMFGLRGGGGIDLGGNSVYGGRIELTELGARHSVQLAVAGVRGARLSEDYQVLHGQADFDYHEETRVWSVALTANYLVRHAGGGPYFVFGLGIGPQWVDWRLDSAYGRLGTPLPDGGSFVEEEGVTLGTMLNAGIGQRLGRHLDVRAEVFTLVVPTTDAREDLKLVPTLTVTTGIGF